jgi:hypothetical protein
MGKTKDLSAPLRIYFGEVIQFSLNIFISVSEEPGGSFFTAERRA